jgi:quercetin dioxygenase-like cupin family protein
MAHASSRSDLDRHLWPRLVQRWGGPVEEIRPGDVVWISPGEKHWHGATPTTTMTHIAVQEALNGNPVEWMEQISDEQYQAL